MRWLPLLFTLASAVRIGALDNGLTPLEAQDGWVLLFDGRTTDGWMNSDRTTPRTPVEEGALNPHKAGHYMLVHTQQWSDFVLALDFKISQGCNSGIFIRTSSLTPLPGKDVGHNGIEIAIDDTPGAGYHDTGAIYDLVKPSRPAMKPVGQWNHIEITSRNNQIDIVLNGEAVTHANLDLFTRPQQRPDGSAHKFDIAYRDHPRRGYIGLQDHGRPCWFKNIKLKPLPDSSVRADAANFPDIGLIEFYGLGDRSSEQVRAALGLGEGDPAPRDRSLQRAIERRLEAIPGVARARLNCVCCTEGKTVVFVGIHETGAPQLRFRDPPTKQLALSEQAAELSRRFGVALEEAVRSGDAGDDVSQGHSLASNRKARAIQEEVIAFAAVHVEELRTVLRHANSPEQRSIAAWMLGYGPDKRAVVPDLLYAVEDADEGVRNEATRSLGAIAALAARRPELGIEIPADRFIEMLRSVEWSDRNKALLVLQALTENRPVHIMKPLKEQAMPALVEMARWRSHGFAAFQIAARVAGVEEKSIGAAWVQGDRDRIIAKAAALPLQTHND
jgi:hypothetical protein